jgi:hypothetical protein
MTTLESGTPVQKYLELSKKILKMYVDGADEAIIDEVYNEMDTVWESLSEDEKETVRIESIKAKENEQ